MTTPPRPSASAAFTVTSTASPDVALPPCAGTVLPCDVLLAAILPAVLDGAVDARVAVSDFPRDDVSCAVVSGCTVAADATDGAGADARPLLLLVAAAFTPTPSAGRVVVALFAGAIFDPAIFDPALFDARAFAGVAFAAAVFAGPAFADTPAPGATLPVAGGLFADAPLTGGPFVAVASVAVLFAEVVFVAAGLAAAAFAVALFVDVVFVPEAFTVLDFADPAGGLGAAAESFAVDRAECAAGVIDARTAFAAEAARRATPARDLRSAMAPPPPAARASMVRAG